MCGNLHLEAFVVICCKDSDSKAWHTPHICIWQDSVVYPEQVNWPVWQVGELSHSEAVVLLMIPSDPETGENQSAMFCF